MAEELITVRIPELPPLIAPLSGEDTLPIWTAFDNKTRHSSLNELMAFFGGGGDGSGVPGPSAAKGRYVFDITQGMVDAAELIGTPTVNLPQFMGKNFTLTIDMRDFLDAEYTVLNSGGFTITIPGFKLMKDMRCTLTFAEPIADEGGGGTPAPTTGGSLITGNLLVTSNMTMTVADVGKLVHLRGGANMLTLTLPDVSVLPAGTIIPIITAFGNIVEQTITTSSGQNIYMNNTSWGTLYMRAGETLWLYRASDGYYVINDFGSIYKGIGRKPVQSYSVGMNELPCQGQLLNRSQYPRLWQVVQTLGQSVVSDSTWMTAAGTDSAGNNVPYPYRGCFSYGDGSTTFRLPNLSNVAIRGLYTNNPDGSVHLSHAERIHNYAGGYQHDKYEQHTHNYDIVQLDITGVRIENNRIEDGGDLGLWAESGHQTTPSGGTETRMKNVGMFYVINI